MGGDGVYVDNEAKQKHAKWPIPTKKRNLPGSLNAICPSSPIPPKNSSIPPHALIRASYFLHSPIRSFAFPLRMFTWEGGMSTLGGWVSRKGCVFVGVEWWGGEIVSQKRGRRRGTHHARKTP